MVAHLEKLTLIATDINSSTKKETSLRLKSCHQLIKLLFHIKITHLQTLLCCLVDSNEPSIRLAGKLRIKENCVSCSFYSSSESSVKHSAYKFCLTVAVITVAVKLDYHTHLTVTVRQNSLFCV